MSTERKIVESLAESVIDSPDHREEINFLFQKLSLDKDRLVKAWLLWDTGIKEYGNDVYKSLSLRLAMHLHNYLTGSWHSKRQERIIEFLVETNPKTICEIGFGIPQKYIKDFVFKNKTVQLTLLDFESEAISFGETLLGFWDNDFRRQVKLNLYDMNDNRYPGDFDMYLFQDSIEHAKEPTNYLSNIVSQAKQGPHFLFSLPVEVDKPIPEHFIFWRDDAAILSWLEKCGLSVLKSVKIEMNREVDVFAKFLHKEFHEIVVLAKKR